LGTGDERGHGDSSQWKNEGTAGNLVEDKGNEQEGVVEGLVEKPGDKLMDSGEESENPAEVGGEVHALEPADEPVDDEDDIEYYDRDGSGNGGDEEN